MTESQMTDIIEELIAVDTKEGFVTQSVAVGNLITFKTSEGDEYRVEVEKVK